MRMLTAAYSLTVATGLLVAALVTDAPASDNPEWRLAVGPTAGALALDGALANYRWDVRPAAQWGARAALYRGRYGAELRIWRTGTVQGTGLAGVSGPSVSLTAVEAAAEARIARYRAIELWSSVRGGRLHVGYEPDRLSFDPGGGGGTVTVDYNAISEWDFGAGLSCRASLARRLALALQVDTTSFALDTAHRVGSSVVLSRERYWNWSLLVELSWLIDFGGTLR
jgi:hypothetical protein